MGEKERASAATVRQAWRERPGSMLGATFFGAGLLPGGPGTYAAALSVPVIALLWRLPLALHIGLFVVVTAASCLWAERAGRALGVHDSRRIVIDEVVGVWLALIVAPDFGLWEAIVGFVAFRVFDVWKPPPIRRVDETFSNGVGVIADDLVAGLYAIPFVLLTRYFV
jgi:phosphatidylglycerophosphatase A